MKATRRFLESRGFLEVDTPLIVPWPDIAPVPPVVVSRGQYVLQGDLRIANTEFMRRLLVSGFDRVYQLGRCFRDEQPSWKHEIEFTQLTFGIAFATYGYLMTLIEELIVDLLSSMELPEVVDYQGHRISFSRPWKRISVRDALRDATGIDLFKCSDMNSLVEAVCSAGLKVPDIRGSYGGLLAQARILHILIDDYVVPTFRGPTWLCEYPFYLGGPAKEITGNPEFKMRAELFIRDIEIANISVPQNNPAMVRKWYEEMLRLKCEKGLPTPYLDEPYLNSMEIGIPVATTGGLGFDRLLMVLLDAPDVRDVLLFSSGSQHIPEGPNVFL
jgi:lysyl-tRNA synthetase class 2